MKKREIQIDQTHDGAIIYRFTGGAETTRKFSTIDVQGKQRDFRITINDEKGITSCVLIIEAKPEIRQPTRKALDLSHTFHPMTLWEMSQCGIMGLESLLGEGTDLARTENNLQEALDLCTILEQGRDYENPTPENPGACGAVRQLAAVFPRSTQEVFKLKGLIDEATKAKFRIEKAARSPIKPSVDLVRELQGFLSIVGKPFYKLAEDELKARKRT